MGSELPLEYYATFVVVVVATLYCWKHRHEGWGLPGIAVLGTITVWYLLDAVYNDYGDYVYKIGPSPLGVAWRQVGGFAVAFTALCKPISRWMCGGLADTRSSSVVEAVSANRNQLDSEETQQRLERLVISLSFIWVILMLVGLSRIRFDFQGLFAPYMGYKRNPWARDRIGGGIDALLSLANYFQIFLTAGFGVLLATLRSSRYRFLVLTVCILAFPFYVFDRTRNTMLATVLPGLLTWVFIRLRGGWEKKILVLGVAFMLVNYWFAFVLSTRTDASISRAFSEYAFVDQSQEVKHLGLNMFEELGWINYFVEVGAYQPNWGKRYFAELVNPIPRSLWPTKPMIGIDYAIARGQGGGSELGAGVHATISTGMIGQGVVNFGPFLGPLAAAALMAAWVGVLARLDLTGTPMRLLLYVLGMTLTFNLGRDITLLVLYPFIFGYVTVRYIENKHAKFYFVRT